MDGFLPLERYGDFFEENSTFALPSGILLGLVNAWQYFQGGLRFSFLKAPVLSGPVRPFYGVYASPQPVAHFELLIEWLDKRHLDSALDLGTGCGVITLILRRIAKIPHVVASDVSPNAVFGAREEFKRHNLTDVEVIETDLFTGLEGRCFDLVVFNPPWLPLRNSSKGEPARSILDKGNFYPQNLFLRIFDDLPTVLKPGGSLVLLFSNHALSRGYVEEHPFQWALSRSRSRDCISSRQVLTRDFSLDGRRRRTGRQVEEDLEPCAELWEFRLENGALGWQGGQSWMNCVRDFGRSTLDGSLEPCEDHHCLESSWKRQAHTGRKQLQAWFSRANVQQKGPQTETSNN